MLNPDNCQECGSNPTTWSPQTEIHLQGVDCAGNLADFVGKPGQIIHTVPKPGAVQAVRLCGEDGLPTSTSSCYQLVYFDEGTIFHEIPPDPYGYYTASYYRVRRKLVYNQCTNAEVSKTLEYRYANTPEAEWYLTPTSPVFPIPV